MLTPTVRVIPAARHGRGGPQLASRLGNSNVTPSRAEDTGGKLERALGQGLAHCGALSQDASRGRVHVEQRCGVDSRQVARPQKPLMDHALQEPGSKAGAKGVSVGREGKAAGGAG